jgi:outer membrane biosynthesis protein TonB
MHLVKTLVFGITLAAVVPGLHAQAKPANGTGTSSATPAAKAVSQVAKPADKPTAKAAAPAAAKPAAAPGPASQNKATTSNTPKPSAPGTKPVAPATNAKPAARAKQIPAAKPAPKQAKKSTARAAKPAASGASSGEKETKVAKRDPFESLVGHEHGGGTTGPLPPGKAGLQVSTLRLDGIVRAPSGMIAVVSNPQSRTYFLREGDQLYDGRVEKIAMDGVSFHEVGKDAFGKPLERQVSKRIYASAGEQQ